MISGTQSITSGCNRIWVTDRGVPTEESLEKMRRISASYLGGTPKGRLIKLEEDFLAQSAARIDKERAMRRRRLGRYIKRLHALRGQTLTRDQLLMKLGAAKQEAGRAAHLIKLSLPKSSSDGSTASFEFALDRAKLRQVRRREANLPPYADALRRHTRLPAWDVVTLLNARMAGLKPLSRSGP